MSNGRVTTNVHSDRDGRCRYSPNAAKPPSGAPMTARAPKRADPQFFDELRSRLFRSVLSDVLDDVGVRNQAMPPRIRPLDDELVLVGLARTGLFRDVYHVAADENPHELEIRILDDLKPGEVVAFGCGGSGRIAPWGELLTTAARARGATGAVTDGFVR